MDSPFHVGAQRAKIGAEQLRHHVDPLMEAREQHITLKSPLEELQPDLGYSVWKTTGTIIKCVCTIRLHLE